MTGDRGPFLRVYESFLYDPKHAAACSRPWFFMLAQLWYRAQHNNGTVEFSAAKFAAWAGIKRSTVYDWLLEMRGLRDGQIAYIELLEKGAGGAPSTYLVRNPSLLSHANSGRYTAPWDRISDRSASGEPDEVVGGASGEPDTSSDQPDGPSGEPDCQSGEPDEVGVPSYSSSEKREVREGRSAHAREPDHPPEPEPDTGHPPQGQTVSPKLDHFAAWDYLTDELSHPFDRMPQGVGKRIDQALAHSTDRAPLELAVGMIQRQIADDPRRAKFAIHDAIQLWALEAKKAGKRQVASQPTTQRDPEEARRTAEIIALQQAHRQRRRAKTGGPL